MEFDGMEVVEVKLAKKEARVVMGLLAVASGDIKGTAEGLGRELTENEIEALTVANEVTERINKEMGTERGDPYFPHRQM